MNWTEIPAGKLHAAEQRLRVALGDSADVVVERVNTDQAFVQQAAGYIIGLATRASTALGKFDQRWLLIHAILGEDIIFTDEITKARGLSYSEEQLRRLAETLPSEEALHWCKANGYGLMPAPPDPMSLLEVRALEPNLFFTKSGGWYADPKEKFATNDKTTFGWLAVRKDIVPNSTDRVWNDQLKLLTAEERVPNAAELTWFLTTYAKVRGKRLFERIWARTSSVASDGHHVFVGFFDSFGLNVFDCWDAYRNDHLGVASARKF